MFVDESAMLAARQKPGERPASELIAIAQKFLETSGGVGGDPEMLADDFQFEGPVVGPLPKKAFVAALGNVDFASAFPDWQGQFYGFHVDPYEGDRVWYTARGEGTQTGALTPALPATGRRVVNPPQVCSITVDHASGLIRRYTIGYVVDRNVGNTGGLGGLYGILFALGKPLPFPEAQPWSPSIPYRLFQSVGGFLSKLAPAE